MTDDEKFALRQKIVAEAESWIGTKFHHMARVKGAGVDCGQLLIEVYERCDCMPHLVTGYYPPDFHRHQDLEWYAKTLLNYCVEVDSGNLLPADIVLFRMKDAKVFSHGGIIVDWPWIVHAAFVQRKVVRGAADTGWLKMLHRRYFRPRLFL
jgi:NlpC/P60 family putative phage cell wall peptidase